MVAGQLFCFIDGQRTVADDRHITFDDVDELRQLVDAEFTDDATDGCNTRVIRNFHEYRIIVVLIFRFHFLQTLVCIGVHTAQFEKIKNAVAGTYSFGSVENIAAVGQFDSKCGQKQERTCGKQSKRSKNHIENSLSTRQSVIEVIVRQFVLCDLFLLEDTQKSNTIFELLFVDGQSKTIIDSDFHSIDTVRYFITVERNKGNLAQTVMILNSAQQHKVFTLQKFVTADDCLNFFELAGFVDSGFEPAKSEVRIFKFAQPIRIYFG